MLFFSPGLSQGGFLVLSISLKYSDARREMLCLLMNKSSFAAHRIASDRQVIEIGDGRLIVICREQSAMKTTVKIIVNHSNIGKHSREPRIELS